MTLPLSRHELIPHPGTGDPVCRCGWTATPSATIRTVHQAAARVSRHAAVHNRLEARPVVYRVRHVPDAIAPWEIVHPRLGPLGVFHSQWSTVQRVADQLARAPLARDDLRRTLGSPPQRQDTTP